MSREDRSQERERRVHEFVESLVRIGCAELVRSLELHEGYARRVMTSIAHAVILEHARTHLYVPVAIALQLDPRNEEIWREYQQAGPDGTRPCTPARIDQLASKHTLTSRQIYDILRLRREQEFADRQGQLPGLDEAA